MKIGVLTSSRADFGIYLPLLNRLKADDELIIEIIAFGTHFSPRHGNTIHEIESKNFKVIHRLKHEMKDENEFDMANSFLDCMRIFTNFWKEFTFDLVLCLGDRFEMLAAVQCGIPFKIRFAHFHGGEQTMGALDNIFRNQITAASSYHFTATKIFAERVSELIGSTQRVFHVGSLSISDLADLELDSLTKFKSNFSIPDLPYILITIHPETNSTLSTKEFMANLIEALKDIPTTLYQVINLPNADFGSALIRESLLSYNKAFPKRSILIESFGKKNYFAAMKYCEFMMGNSSSGIIEGASFGKFVINIGERQKGRLQSENVINSNYKKNSILKNVNLLLKGNKTFDGENRYYKQNAVSFSHELIKQILDGRL